MRDRARWKFVFFVLYTMSPCDVGCRPGATPSADCEIPVRECASATPPVRLVGGVAVFRGLVDGRTGFGLTGFGLVAGWLGSGRHDSLLG